MRPMYSVPSQDIKQNNEVNFKRLYNLCYHNKIHPHAGQHFHKKEPYVAGTVSDFTSCSVLVITSGWRALSVTPFSPPPSLPPSLSGADWSHGVVLVTRPQCAIKARSFTQACQMDCQTRSGVTSGFDI